MGINRALFLGRFNPFHMGHLEAIKYILSVENEIIIAIGSIQLSHSLQNPFTAGERLEMIRQSLIEYGIPLNKVFIIPAFDINRNAIYIAHLESFLPKFYKVYTNNPLIRQLFLEKGYIVESLGFYNRKEYSGKEIRRRMIGNEPWEHLLPKSVVRIIYELNGLERIKNICQNDDEAI